MAETNQWPLIQGIARIWPNNQLQCHFCLGLFSSRDRRRCYCSKVCRRAMHNAVRRKEELDRIGCPICHRNFVPRQRNQRFCSAECRKLAHYRRRKGEPEDRLTSGCGDQGQERRRARRLSTRRCDREDEREANGPFRPYQHHVGIIGQDEPLPDDVMTRIQEILADKTPSARDEGAQDED